MMQHDVPPRNTNIMGHNSMFIYITPQEGKLLDEI